MTCGFALLLATPAFAQRPSLIDLQAAIDDLVSPPPPPASGRIQFSEGSDTYTFEIVDLTLSARRDTCIPSCAAIPDFDPVQVTVLTTPGLAALSTRLAAGSNLASARGERDPSDPRDPYVRFLDLTDVELMAIDATSEPGRSTFQFIFSTIELDWEGSRMGWDLPAFEPINPTCDPDPLLQTYVDLAGNPSSNLLAGEIEGTSMFTVAPAPGNVTVGLRYARTPVDACSLRGVTDGRGFDVRFGTLWSLDDAFPGRQSVETIQLFEAAIWSWALQMRSGEVTEEFGVVIDLLGVAAPSRQTLRSFDEATGAETDSETFSF